MRRIIAAIMIALSLSAGLSACATTVTSGIVRVAEMDYDAKYDNKQVKKCRDNARAGRPETADCRDLRRNGNPQQFSDFEVVIEDAEGNITRWEFDDQTAFDAAVVGQPWTAPAGATVDTILT